MQTETNEVTCSLPLATTENNTINRFNRRGRTAIGLVRGYTIIMQTRPMLFLTPMLLLALSGCKHLPDTSEPYWWSPFGPPEFEKSQNFDEKGNWIGTTVYVDPEYAEAEERQRLIQLLEENNRLLERLADER